MVKCILSSESCQLMRDQIYMNAAYDFSIILQSDRCAVHITERRVGSQIGRRDMAHVRQSRPDSVRVPTFERTKRGVLCISGSARRPPRTSSPGTRRSTGSRCPTPGKVNVRLPGKGNSNSHGARPVHLIITMIKWIRTGTRRSTGSRCPKPFAI